MTTTYDTAYVAAAIRDHSSDESKRIAMDTLVAALRDGFPTSGDLVAMDEGAKLGRRRVGSFVGYVALDWSDNDRRPVLWGWRDSEPRTFHPIELTLEWDCIERRFFGRGPTGERIDAARVVIDAMLASPFLA